MQLNLETRSFHAAADEGWLALVRPDVTRWDYLRQLVSTYGFEAPLEAAFAYTPNLRVVLTIDLRARARAGFAAQDLLRLGLKATEIANLPQCSPIAPFGSPLEALGWMYVVERATLIHDQVRRHLSETLPEPQRSFAYLGAYAGSVGARWNAFGAALDHVARTPSMLGTVITAAHAGFRRLESWTGVASRIARHG